MRAKGVDALDKELQAKYGPMFEALAENKFDQPSTIWRNLTLGNEQLGTFGQGVDITMLRWNN